MVISSLWVKATLPGDPSENILMSLQKIGEDQGPNWQKQLGCLEKVTMMPAFSSQIIKMCCSVGYEQLQEQKKKNTVATLSTGGSVPDIIESCVNSAPLNSSIIARQHKRMISPISCRNTVEMYAMLWFN